jgi:homoserine acetyltransferase
VGVDKTIDTRKYTIVSFDVPGNGFNSATIENYRDFITEIARIFIEGFAS